MRLSNVYGPRQDPRGEAGVIAMFCDAAIEGRVPTVFGDGGQTRDFVYVGDAVEAFATAGESRVGGFANVATGTETTVLELARALGLAPCRRPSGPARSAAPASTPGLAAELLGWHPRTTLADGLAATLTSMARGTRRARGA